VVTETKEQTEQIMRWVVYESKKFIVTQTHDENNNKIPFSVHLKKYYNWFFCDDYDKMFDITIPDYGNSGFQMYFTANVKQNIHTRHVCTFKVVIN
jgi:hypothetical protein